MSGNLENFLAAFPGHKNSPFYGMALDYLPDVPMERAPIIATRAVRAVKPNVNLVGDNKFAVIDPNQEIIGQLMTALASGFKFVELAQPTAMSLGQFTMLLTHIHGLGLGVIARNAFASVGPFPYLSHPNVFGCVVERDNGHPIDYDRLRREVRKDGLMPVWHVFSGFHGSNECADAIRAYDLKGIGVSASTKMGLLKYDDSHIILTPNA